MFLVEILQKRKFQELLKKELSQRSAFKDESYFDTLSSPKKILGREDKIQEILSMIIGYKKNFLPPLVSVYGRSGSGKSTVVKFVTDNLPDATTCFVNLRKTKTIFGAANMILEELGEKGLTPSNGLNKTIENIQTAITQKLIHEKTNTIFIVLDEVDSILTDKRGDPSDFFYKLLVLIEEIKKEGNLGSIITISNNIFDHYNLDDRVKSRIGNNNILFEAYSKDEVIKILKEISKKALYEKVNSDVLEYCAFLSSSVHGDARRAIDLLYSGIKLSIKENCTLSKKHITQAENLINSEFVIRFLKNSPFHMKVLSYVLGKITFISGQQWHYTSAIEKVYSASLAKGQSRLGYRRISDLLNELEQAGLLESSTKTLGRYGSGKMYRLKFPAEIIGKYFPKKFESWKKMKDDYHALQNDPDIKYNRDPRLKFDRFNGIKEYREFLGQF